MMYPSLAMLALLLVAFDPLHAATLMLTAPLEYQVIQRENRDRGNIIVEGRLAGLETKDFAIEGRIVTIEKAGQW